MLLNRLRQEYNEDLLRFLWRQWSQLGVAGDLVFQDRWLIDPEALLLFTLYVTRRDPRLFDEVIDWSVQNSRWLSVQRLKNLSTHQLQGLQKNILISLARVIDQHDASGRWRSIANAPMVPTDREELLFLTYDGEPLPMLGQPDPTFRQVGLIRPPVALRRLSRPVPMDPSTNLLFKLRSLFGLGTRPEVLAYLLTHAHGYASGVAKSTFYSKPSVQDTLAELAQSGLVEVQQSNREKLYSTDAGRWRKFLLLMALPIWVEWSRVFRGLSVLVDFLADKRLEQLSDYMLQSRVLTLSETLHECFASSGIPAKFPPKSSLADSAKYFEPRVRALLYTLNKRPSSQSGTRIV